MSGGLVGRVEQLLELAGKATARPWEWRAWRTDGYSDERYLAQRDGPIGKDGYPPIVLQGYGAHGETSEIMGSDGDAALIVAAVNLVEPLARDWQRIREVVRQVIPLAEEVVRGTQPGWDAHDCALQIISALAAVPE